MSISDKTAKILIVDDEPVNIEVLSGIVEPFGEVLFATNGETALRLADDEVPDLILLDVMMPGMDGYTVCRRLKSNEATSDIPVMFVSALSQEMDEALGLELGAVDYVSKPVSAAITAARVRNHLDLKRYRDHLEKIAFIDALTQIPNRRRFDDVAQTEWKRSLRQKAPLSVLLLDIDHFKLFNDHYGHQAGDLCLTDVAQTLQLTLRRPADLVARYGGEEFICLLPDTDHAGATTFAGTLCDAVRDLKIAHAHSPSSEFVTVSIGGATTEVGADVSLDDLISAADANLYAAKDNGRDTVVCTDI